jgi:hypothetical protein
MEVNRKKERLGYVMAIKKKRAYYGLPCKIKSHFHVWWNQVNYQIAK